LIGVKRSGSIPERFMSAASARCARDLVFILFGKDFLNQRFEARTTAQRVEQRNVTLLRSLATPVSRRNSSDSSHCYCRTLKVAARRR
jgi:hypothetical protein